MAWIFFTIGVLILVLAVYNQAEPKDPIVVHVHNHIEGSTTTTETAQDQVKKSKPKTKKKSSEIPIDSFSKPAKEAEESWININPTDSNL